MENKDKNRIAHIAGLKGSACLLIMAGHFLGVYKYAASFIPRIHIIDIIAGSKVSFLINESYWLYLFFVISGYLVAKSDVRTIRDVVLKAVTRFFRFLFPILFAYIVIYVIYIICGFHAAETAGLFQCDWYQGTFPGVYSIRDVILGPYDVLFRHVSALNSPYWVLRDMFRASVVIYILKYAHNKLVKEHEAICFSALVLITFASIKVSIIITACLIGMLVSLYESAELQAKGYFAFWAMVVLMALYILPTILLAALFFASLIVFIPKVNWIDHLFSSKPLQFLEKNSWGIYSFHWPLMCSVGARLLIGLFPLVGLKYAYAITLPAVSILTLLLSIGYHWTSCEIKQSGQNYRYQRLRKSEGRNAFCDYDSVRRECETF